MNEQGVIVTGGAGFIGSALVRYLINETDNFVVNVDKLTYAGNLASLDSVAHHERYKLEVADICDHATIGALLEKYRPRVIYHLAAESHVDRSIENPVPFIVTNIFGTYSMLARAFDYWTELDADSRNRFRFVHISTDEVFGSLGESGQFDETSNYQPTSPYSASKAAADHLVHAWFHTYGLPITITHSSNNFGPCQLPEKLIPLMIMNAIHGKPLPVYGTGSNVRDWLYVEDHAIALHTVAERGEPGGNYMVGSNSERSNLEVVHTICTVLDEILPSPTLSSYAELIRFVADRPGHDLRYAINATRLRTELGWQPRHTFESAIRKTVEWYVQNSAWRQTLRPEVHEERRGLALDRVVAANAAPRLEII